MQEVNPAWPVGEPYRALREELSTRLNSIVVLCKELRQRTFPRHPRQLNFVFAEEFRNVTYIR